MLGIPDGWKFVDSRMSKVNSATHPVPLISEEMVRSFMEDRTTEGAPINIRELELLFTRIFESAMERQAQKIVDRDFLRYYLGRNT